MIYVICLMLYHCPSYACLKLATHEHGLVSITNNISQATVALINLFTAGFDITSISSNVTSDRLHLGSINTVTSFNSAGKCLLFST
jgi:hypothetical protein